MTDPSPTHALARPEPEATTAEATTAETTTAEAPAATADPGRARSRRDHTGRDMLLSLAALLVPILLIGGLVRACSTQGPTVVDTAAAIDDARAANLFPVVVPQGLPDGWHPVAATWRRTTDGLAGSLRLGYLTPSGSDALFVVSNEESGALLGHELGDQITPQGEVTVNGQAWTSSAVRGEEHALVLAQAVRTIIVVGHAPLDELTALAASLE